MTATEPATGPAGWDAYDAHVRALVDAAPPLTPEQRDRLAAILRGVVADTPGPRAPRSVASAGSASRRFSAGSRATGPAAGPHAGAEGEHGPLTRPGFGETPGASS